jgi:hypothetical protein
MLDRFGETLEGISKDTNKAPGDSGRYMTSSHAKAVNFDKFKNEYIKNLQLPEAPLSCDAFIKTNTNEWFLIEFKNGKIEVRKNFEIKVKIFESLLILLDKLNKTIEFSRDNLNFILVYNENVAHGLTQFNNMGFDAIQTKLFSLANSRKIRFGLRRFQNIYFKKVFTYSKTEYENNFVLGYSL